MLERVKTALRITSTITDFDNEITDLIEECKADLRLAGIVNINDSDPLILRACILYAKANFGYSDDVGKHLKPYALHKLSLSLDGGYCVQ